MCAYICVYVCVLTYAYAKYACMIRICVVYLYLSCTVVLNSAGCGLNIPATKEKTSI